MKRPSVRWMTLGGAATAKVRVIVWCRDCQHRFEPDPEEHAALYGANLAVIDWGQAAQMLALRQPARRFRSHRGAAVSFQRLGAPNFA